MCYEYSIELHNIFVDYNQAFDSVNRNIIIECLNNYEVPKKLIKLIGLTLTNTTARIKIGSQLNSEFRIVSGIKQGDPLSATLFSIVIDNVIKQLDLKGNISTRLKQCSVYADDILLTTRTIPALKDTFQRLKKTSLQAELTINEHKTKYIRCTKKQHKVDGIDNTQTHLEQVKSFKYLGSIVKGNNSVEEEMKSRISVGNEAFYANQDLFKSKLLTRNSKLRMYKTLVRPVVTYVCERWVLKENIKTKLRVFERKVLRRIYGPSKGRDGTWRIKSNEELKRLTGNKDIINYIEAQGLAWFGHVHRMPDNSMVKKIYEWSPALTRLQGRPKNRWDNEVRNDLTRMKIINWKDCIRYRDKWKKLVEKDKTSLKL
jgi:hypothetical protein